MTVLTDKPKVGQTDAALLVEELTEIYTTPTPKGWHGAKKSKLYLIDWMSFTIVGVQYYTRRLNMNPTQVRLITIFGIKENIPILRLLGP